MDARIRSSRNIAISTPADLSAARAEVRAHAELMHFDPFATAALTTAAAELVRTMWVHAGAGTVTIAEVEEGGRMGIRIEVRDGHACPGGSRHGAAAGGAPGPGDDGFALAACRRLVDTFDMRSPPGEGTSVTIQKWKRF